VKVTLQKNPLINPVALLELGRELNACPQTDGGTP